MKIRKFLPMFGIILLIYLLIKINIFKIFIEIKQVNLFLLILASIIIFVFFLTSTLKWFVIAKKQKIPVSFKEALKINIITNFYGFVTPSKAGTIIRADYLKKYTGHIGKGISNFVLDKILDIISLFFMAVIFSFVFKDKIINIPTKLFFVIFLILGTLTFIFVKKERSKPLLRIFYKKLVPNKMKKSFKENFEAFYQDMPKKRYFLFFFIINLMNWVVIYFITFIIGLSLGIKLNFIYYLAILPIGTIIGLIPITINGFGTREASLITLFRVFNISAIKVFSMSLLSLFITGVIPSIIAVIILLKKPKKDNKNLK